MLKFFDRYLLKEIIPPFFIGFLIYSFVLLMNQVFLLSELFIARGVSFTAVTLIFIYLIPAVLAFAIPMSVLMGILAGLSRLSSDSEIVAFRTLGIRNSRLLWPVFVFAFAGWLITSALTLYLAPPADLQAAPTLHRPKPRRAPRALFAGPTHPVPRAEPERYRITLFDRIEEEINVESLFAQFSSEKRGREKDIGELIRSVATIGGGREDAVGG